jgi:ketosteroid isomerase-like protein
MYKILSALSMVCLLFSGCSNDKIISRNEMRDIVKKCNDKLGEYYIAGDAEKLTGMYDNSAVIAPNGNDFYSGLQSISSMYTNDVKQSKILEMRTETITVDGNKEIIYETGKTYLKINYNDSTYNTHVKYCNIWKLQPDGTYKLAVDIWNKDKQS